MARLAKVFQFQKLNPQIDPNIGNFTVVIVNNHSVNRIVYQCTYLCGNCGSWFGNNLIRQFHIC